jgi:hypothetical protein
MSQRVFRKGEVRRWLAAIEAAQRLIAEAEAAKAS